MPPPKSALFPVIELLSFNVTDPMLEVPPSPEPAPFPVIKLLSLSVTEPALLIPPPGWRCCRLSSSWRRGLPFHRSRAPAAYESTATTDR
jgi:hypothetical protein